jgi:Zn-dependent protease/CBS domain-containing protein
MATTRSGGGGLMGSSIRLGRIAGVEISITWSWLLIFAFVVVTLAASVFPATNEGLGTGTYIAMGVVAAVLFFASLLLHELGHAVEARREGMEISGITLWLFGGVSSFKGTFPSAGAEFRIAIAGPLVTLVIGAALVLVGGAFAFPSAVDGVVVWLGVVNLFLLGFNLLPAFPLDGGRVLRSILWKVRGDFGWATSVAGAVGRVLGALMIAVGVLSFLVTFSVGGLWLALIGWFVMAAGTGEIQLAAARQALAGLTAADAMGRDPITVTPDLTLREFADGVLTAHRHAIYPVTDNGVVLGVLASGDVRTVPQLRWDSVRVRDQMRPFSQVAVVREEDDLAEVLTMLQQSDLRRALVFRDSQLTGLLSVSDVERLIELRRGQVGSRSLGRLQRRPRSARS